LKKKLYRYHYWDWKKKWKWTRKTSYMFKWNYFM